jgi:hypothetical protein
MLLTVGMLIGCSRVSDVRVVTSEEYSSRACWIDANGYLSAFLAFADDTKYSIPYVMSASCLVGGDYASDGESILLNLGKGKMVEPTSALQQAFPNVVLVDPRLSDQPLPSSSSRVYFIQAGGKEVRDGLRSIFKPTRVVQAEDTGVRFEKFLDLSRAARAELRNSRFVRH